MSEIIEQQLVDIGNNIENLVYMHDISYIDACILYCTQNDLEVEYIGEIIQKNYQLRARIQSEAEQLNFIKKSSRLFL